MNILEFSEVEILYNAIVKADAIIPVNSPLQELTLGIADFYNERLIKVIAPFELLLNRMLYDDKIDIDFKDFFEDSKKEEVLAMMNLQITISNVSTLNNFF